MSQSFTDNSRGIITVTGQDATQFLQGLITNDIGKSNSDSWLYALILTAQGKIITDVFIKSSEDGYLLDCPRLEIPAITARLKLYQLRSRVKIEQHPSFILLSEKEGLADPRHPKLWRRSLTMEMAPFNGEETYHSIRMDLLIPDFTMDLWAEKFYPHELGMNNLHAIDYKKGCYVGQEVTARVEYRGVVRKKLHLLRIQKASKGEAIVSGVNGKEVGVMLGHSNELGLALLREDELNDLHTAGGLPLTLVK